MLFKEEAKEQPQVAESLRSAFANGRVPHALLFVGSRQAGQKAMALAFARALFAGEGPAADTKHRRLLENGAHPDWVFVEPPGEGQFIKVGTVREVIHRASLKPLLASAKVIVIEGAEWLHEVAQHALLKTLEEPPPRTYFILIASDLNRLLITIRSRAQNFYFAPANARAEETPEEALLRKELLAFLLPLLTGEREPRPGDPPDFSGLKRDQALRLMDYLTVFFREVLVVRTAGGSLLKAPEQLKEKERWASRLDEDALIGAIEFFADSRDRLLHNANVKLVASNFWNHFLPAEKSV